jgi:hypothetical protein
MGQKLVGHLVRPVDLKTGAFPVYAKSMRVRVRNPSRRAPPSFLFPLVCVTQVRSSLA